MLPSDFVIPQPTDEEFYESKNRVYNIQQSIFSGIVNRILDDEEDSQGIIGVNSESEKSTIDKSKKNNIGGFLNLFETESIQIQNCAFYYKILDFFFCTHKYIFSAKIKTKYEQPKSKHSKPRPQNKLINLYIMETLDIKLFN